MIDSNRRRLSGLTLAATLCSTIAGAQTVARSFEELQRALKPRQTVMVTDGSCAKTKGRVLEISGSSLRIRTREQKRDSSGQEYTTWTGQRTFAESDVIEIRRKDSLWNGTLLGFSTGVAAYALARATDSCAPFPYDLCYNSYGAFPFVVYPTVGAIAGALIDRATGNGKVYLPPSQGSVKSVAVSPWLHRSSGGVAVSMKF